jgi:glycosyltransferase involved in cell wall biosynthesis
MTGFTNRNQSCLLVGNMAGKMGYGHSVCETLADLLNQAGWQVYIASGKMSRIPRVLEMVTTTWKYRKEYPVALIEVFSGWAFICAEAVAWLLRRMNKPYILALYGGNLPNFASHNSHRVKNLLCSADLVLSPSAYLKDLMEPYCADIKVLSYGVDLSEFRFRQRIQPLPHFMTMRAFHDVYNLPLAVDVVALLKDEYPEIRLMMSGGKKGDAAWEQVQEEINYYHLDEKIKWLGFLPRPAVPEWMNHADIILNTPNIDNTPVSLIEAMACGLCIVSTNVGGLPYLLEDGKDALLVPPGDPHLMAAAARRILSEAGLAENLSRNAWLKAKNYSWDVVFPRWENMLREVSQRA